MMKEFESKKIDLAPLQKVWAWDDSVEDACEALYFAYSKKDESDIFNYRCFRIEFSDPARYSNLSWYKNISLTDPR